MPESKEKAPRLVLLSKAPLFAELTAPELGYLAERAIPRRFRSGEVIFTEGDACHGMWVVQSGLVKVYKSSPSGREQVLTLESCGQAIAELPVFDGGDYPASAQAVEDTTLLFLSRQSFDSLCVVYPQVGIKMLRVIGQRLRRLLSIIEELSFTTVRGRLASLLLRLARNGKKTAEGMEITLPTTNQELAAQIGTVRELVSRNLSRLQAAGVIRMEGRTVVIPNLKALEQEIERE